MQDNSSPQIKVAVTLLYPYPSSLIDAIPLETYDVPQNDPQFVCHPLKTDAITRGCPYSWFNLGKTIPKCLSMLKRKTMYPVSYEHLSRYM